MRLGFQTQKEHACVFFFFFFFFNTVKDVREPLLLSGLRGMPSLQLHSPRKLSQTVWVTALPDERLAQMRMEGGKIQIERGRERGNRRGKEEDETE